MPRSAIAPLGLTSQGINQKVENATLKISSVNTRLPHLCSTPTARRDLKVIGSANWAWRKYVLSGGGRVPGGGISPRREVEIAAYRRS